MSRQSKHGKVIMIMTLGRVWLHSSPLNGKQEEIILYDDWFERRGLVAQINS